MRLISELRTIKKIDTSFRSRIADIAYIYLHLILIIILCSIYYVLLRVVGYSTLSSIYITIPITIGNTFIPIVRVSSKESLSRRFFVTVELNLLLLFTVGAFVIAVAPAIALSWATLLIAVIAFVAGIGMFSSKYWVATVRHFATSTIVQGMIDQLATYRPRLFGGLRNTHIWPYRYQIAFPQVPGATPVSIEPNSNIVAPYNEALVELQQILTQVKGDEPPQPRVKSIPEGSLVLKMEGTADALRALIDVVLPWRRKFAKQRADLEVIHMQLQNEQMQAEILEARARAQRAHVEAKITEEEVEEKRLSNAGKRLVLEEKRTELEKQQLELYQAKIDMASKIIEKFNPQLSETERFAYVIRILKPLNVLVESPLEIVPPKDNIQRQEPEEPARL
jgi:hypothetical protein